MTRCYPWCPTMVVSQREGQKNIRIVCHIFKTRPEAQWNAVKNKYTVAWHPELNLQQPDITRYSNDSLINALAMGQSVTFLNAQPKMYLQQAVGRFSFLRYSTEFLYLILYISTQWISDLQPAKTSTISHHVEATSVSWTQGCRDRIRSLYPSYLKELVLLILGSLQTYHDMI